jgi:hypothetical protein
MSRQNEEIMARINEFRQKFMYKMEFRVEQLFKNERSQELMQWVNREIKNENFLKVTEADLLMDTATLMDRASSKDRLEFLEGEIGKGRQVMWNKLSEFVMQLVARNALSNNPLSTSDIFSFLGAIRQYFAGDSRYGEPRIVGPFGVESTLVEEVYHPSHWRWNAKREGWGNQRDAILANSEVVMKYITSSANQAALESEVNKHLREKIEGLIEQNRTPGDLGKPPKYQWAFIKDEFSQDGYYAFSLSFTFSTNEAADIRKYFFHLNNDEAVYLGLFSVEQEKGDYPLTHFEPNDVQELQKLVRSAQADPAAENIPFFYKIDSIASEQGNYKRIKFTVKEFDALKKLLNDSKRTDLSKKLDNPVFVYVAYPHITNHSISVLHTRYAELSNAQMPTEVFLEKLAEFAYLSANMMLYARGSSAITEWMMRGLAKAHGIELGPFDHEKGIGWDWQAFLLPPSDYIKQFQTHFTYIRRIPGFDSTVVSDEQPALRSASPTDFFKCKEAQQHDAPIDSSQNSGHTKKG